jgi:hypothetical protein
MLLNAVHKLPVEASSMLGKTVSHDQVIQTLRQLAKEDSMKHLAQKSSPKPDPALEKLQILVGHWTAEGEYKAGPLGPGGKFTGEYIGQMILGGFFFQGQETQKGTLGEKQILDIEWYDPLSKNFASSVYQSDGSALLGLVATVSGNTVTWAGKFVFAGKQYLIKTPMVVEPGLMSATAGAKISVDGNTWIPFMEAKYTKVKLARKK